MFLINGYDRKNKLVIAEFLVSIHVAAIFHIFILTITVNDGVIILSSSANFYNQNNVMRNPLHMSVLG